MRTAILTDTNTGVGVEELKKIGIFAIPMPVIIDGKDYLEGESITHAKLYEKMLAGCDVMTSMPAPGRLTDMWDEILAQGYDEIVYIPMSSGLSGSCHAAKQFAQEYNGRVQVADNHRISVTLYESVLDAKALADQGMDAKEICEHLEDNGYHASIYIAVNTLAYLKKSGRVTPAGAAIASVMNIKPVLTIQGGKLDAFAKTRGMKAAMKKIIDAVGKDLEIRFSDVPRSRLRIGTAGTFQNPEDAENWTKAVADAYPEIKVSYIPLSCSIACHTGIDAVGVGISCIEKRK